MTPRAASAVSSSPARISASRRWFSGVSSSGSTISPSSPRVQVTRTTPWPAAAAFAMTPPVPIVSSSGWAWTVMRTWRVEGVGDAGMAGWYPTGPRRSTRLGADGGGPARYDARAMTAAPRSRPARRAPRRRLQHGAGRALRNDAPRRPRGGRRQGGAAGGGRDAWLGAAVGRRGRGPDRGLLPRRQPQQAIAAPGPQGRGRPRRCSAACSRGPTSSSRTTGWAGSPASASTTRRSRR